jgi:trimeric autotransporter adhesin
MKNSVPSPPPLSVLTRQVLTVALISLCALLVSASSGPQLFRRQFGSCQDQCAWAENLANCSSTDITCACDVFNAAGPTTVNGCVTCLQASDASLAGDLSEVDQGCSQEGSGNSTASPTVSASAGANAEAGSDPCATLSACATVSAAVSTCSDDSCFCPTALPFIAACASCYASVNATSSADLLSASSLCVAESYTGVATSTTVDFAVGPCVTPCQKIDAAISSCTDDACFCPTLVSFGSACSACWATANGTEAGVLSSGIAGCASEFATGGATGTGGNSVGQTAGATATAISGSSTASATHSSAAMRGETFVFFSPVHGIVFGAFVAGVLTLFG